LDVYHTSAHDAVLERI